MSTEPGRGDVDAELERVLDRLERPVARPQFRAALRERFLAGAVAADASGAATNAAHSSATSATSSAEATVAERARPTAIAPPRRRPILLGAALAAAAAIVLTLFLTKVRAPTWRVHESTTATSVVVDGVALRTDDAARLVDALGTARELEAHGGMLRLCVRDEAWIELADGTRLSQMKFAAAGPYQVRTESGSLGVSTLAAFAGRGMRVLTDDFDLHVTGTTFAVDVDARGSCLCTLEGSVQCKPAGDKTAQPVATGRMCFAHRDGTRPNWGTAHESHLAPLRALRE